MDADAADQAGAVALVGEDQQRDVAGGAWAGEKGFGMLHAIGPGHLRKHPHDLGMGDGAGQRGRVLGPAGS